jgi:hypothetical protein
VTNLNFDTGTYKEYQLNGKETIRVNVGDPGIIDRLKGCGERIDQITAELGDDITEENLGKLDKEIRKMVDDVLNCPGACDKAFGATHCLAIAGGKPIIINFVQVLIEQLAEDMKQTVSAVKINESISKQNELDILDNERTRKYIKMNKEAMEREHKEALKEKLNVAALSPYERKMLLDELLGVSK